MPTLAINGATIAYEDQGEGEPLLFIHGIFVSKKQWQAQIDHFAQNYRVIACDLRGHGQSSATASPYSVSMFAADIIALLDQLGLKQVICCGHSFGGMVAQELTLSYPDRIKALVLAETLYGTVSTPWEAAMTSMSNIVMPQLISFENQARLFAWYFGMFTPGSSSFLMQEAQRHMDDAAHGQNVLSASFKFDSRWRLNQIKCPTLIMISQFMHLPLVYLHAYEMLMWIRGARLAVIPNAGHLMHVDNTAAFNRTMGRFIAEL
jgi:pimeloyl-ACP methyl ester carboxylesterase